jgi:26S proteasome regulatory subunit (ATPase 3-interacting protein)
MPPAAPKRKKMKTEGGHVERTILAYVNHQNRPLSVSNIVDRLASEGLGTTQAKKSLEILEQSEAVSTKEYGKSKYYLAKQDQFEVLSENELRSADNRISTKKAELQELQAARMRLARGESEADNEIPEDELDRQLDEARKACTASEQKLVSVKSGPTVTKADVDAMTKQAAGRLVHWRVRKRVCDEFCASIAEKTGKKLAALHDDIGIETDEMSGVDLKQCQDAIQHPNSDHRRR